MRTRYVRKQGNRISIQRIVTKREFRMTGFECYNRRYSRCHTRIPNRFRSRLTIKATSKFSIVTVVNRAKYQDKENKATSKKSGKIVTSEERKGISWL